jgi:predicted dehydrogenase
MSAPVRLGLVGAGAISRAYVAALADSRVARLVGVADIDAESAASLVRGTEAAVFSSHLDLATGAACDAVIVTTPPATHARIAIDLMSWEIPVLCEKPLSVDLDSARQMARTAEEHGVLLSMASKFRFTDDVIGAREMIAAGEIGTPLILENVFTGVVDMTRRWNANPAVSGGGVLIDNGTHSVDIVRYLLGPITAVFAVAWPRLQPIEVEDGVTLVARTASGALATVETSWSVHKDRGVFIGIYGTEGAVEVGWKGSRLRRRHGGPWEPFGTGYDKVAAFARQIEHFVGALRGEPKPLPDVADALASVSVIQAAYQSMARGSWVEVGAGVVVAERVEMTR